MYTEISNDMIEIRIHGRGGQGGVTLAKILATAQQLEGKSAQAFGIYAAERSGAPVQSFLRYDEEPIHNPNQIYEPDHLIVLDPTLISPAILAGLKPGGWILLNCDQPPEHYSARPAVEAFRIATIDASSIAVENGLGSKSVPIVNTAMAGAVARLLNMQLDSALDAFKVFGFHGANTTAARDAWARLRMQKTKPKQGDYHHPVMPRRRGPGLMDGNSGALPAIRTGQWANQQPVWKNATPPCNFVCPAGNDVQGFLAALTREDVDDALEVLLETSPLPSVCGRVCPGFCMTQCNRAELEGPVNVRALERYVGDHGQSRLSAGTPRDESVAVIGAGPAGLSGAYHLARLGYKVTLFEAGDELGGLMRTGIPAYRLPREALDRDIDRILELGIECVFNARIGHDQLEQLTHKFDAVLAATGLQRLSAIDLGENSELEQGRVMQGIEFLDLARQGKIQLESENLIVIGGGNTAIDAARSAFRLGANSVRIVYRRTREEMPAIPEEVDDALDEGIKIDFLCSPTRLSRVKGTHNLSCQRMELGSPDDSGRRRPVAVEGSEFEIPCDRVILAIGQAADLSLLPDEALPSRENPMHAGGHAPVYPAGDLLTNEGTVTAAIGCGREMALTLHERFSGEKRHAGHPAEETVVRGDQIRLHHFPRQQAVHQREMPMAARISSFDEVHQGLDDIEEARRCLSCGVCNSCDRCVTYCPDGVLKRVGTDIIFDYDYCKGCGVCVSECSRAVIYLKAG
jgi:2-oxoacid:acceptor oxidoreductase gamma subunit (pyruvate/2-ketoisovalerate family)